MVNASLRDLTWKDISNISEFRHMVRTTKHLCKYVYSSINTDAGTVIEDRDYPKKWNAIDIPNSNGDCQGK